MGILNILGGLLIFVIILGLIIAVHEGGHFFFARRAGILAREFALGMGPILWKKKKGETLYTIRAIPIGGFCAIAGEEVEDDPFQGQPRIKLEIVDGVIKGFYFDLENEELDYPIYDIMEYDIYDQEETGNLYMEVIREGERFRFTVAADAVVYLPKFEYQIAPYNRTIGSKSKRARAMVMFGGPLMNFLLALVVFLLAGLITGSADPNSTRINVASEEGIYTPADFYGLETNDTIKSLEAAGLGKRDVYKWEDISKFMVDYRDGYLTSKINVTVERAGEILTKEVAPTIAFNNLAMQVVVEDAGLRVIAYTGANDGMLNNKALESYYRDSETGLSKDLILTGFTYRGEEELVNPANLEGVYRILRSFDGEDAEQITISFLSNGEPGEVEVTPYNRAIMDYQTKQSGLEVIKVALGVSPVYNFSLLGSIKYSLSRTVSSGTAVFQTLGLLFRGDVPLKALSGFVGIADATVKVTKSGGFLAILNWIGLLSVNIGLLNLFPIPALDGGRLVFLGYEAITKKKPNPKIETWLITVTMFLLFGLMIYVTINDIIKIG